MRRVALACALVACAEPSARPAPAGPAAFAMPSPDVAVLAEGDGIQLQHQFHDSAGRVITADAPSFRSSDTTIVRVSARGRVSAIAPGETEVVASLGAARASTRVRVVRDEGEGTRVDVFPTVEHQQIRGWEASAQFGEIDCKPEAFTRYHREMVDRIVNELGITRLRLTARSGIESSVDTWPDFREGRMPYARWRRTWFVAANDNADPRVADPAGFHWTHFDRVVDTVIVPIRQAMAARGESLYLNLNYVDFFLGAGSKAFPQMKSPEEYAELIRVIFDHMRDKYGFTPDALEVLLEPENTPYTPEDVGASLVAVARRLREGGYTPDFIGPSTTKAANAPAWWDAVNAVPGARGLFTELAYHKYGALSRPTLNAILLRARRDGVPTAMLEHIGSGFDGLYEDLTLANASAWEQFTLGYCGTRDNPDNGGVYYQVNQTDPSAPRINITNEARLMRQVFNYVRPRAVRLGAASSREDLRALAFRNATGRLVVVARSRNGQTMQVHGLPAGTYGVNYSTRTGRFNVDLPDVMVRDGVPVSVNVPADAALTLYGRP